MALRNFSFLISCSLCLLLSCSVTKKISKQANTILLNDTAVSTGHIGISIYEPATNKYWYNYNGTHYFIPASNTKLFTLYAGMKYLGDSLVGIRYQNFGNTLVIYPAADPTFLHKDFLEQPVVKFLQNSKESEVVLELNKKDFFRKYGAGWSWNDYNESYMTERSRFPFYGNTIQVIINKDYSISTVPKFNVTPPAIALTEKEYDFAGADNIFRPYTNTNFIIINKDKTKPGIYSIPFTNYSYSIPLQVEGLIPYADTIHKNINVYVDDKYRKGDSLKYNRASAVKKIYSQPSDSLFKPMMHQSDNFFAEQTLLMASNEYLGFMSDEKMIDTMLKSSLKDLPQRPRWVDGSGLSRYNLFTPNDFVYLLNKMKNEFGLERLKVILPAGNEGTLRNYYVKDASFIYAKTGTLSNNCALSGFLVTKHGKLLIFSILANNYITGATPVRRAVERFLQNISDNY